MSETIKQTQTCRPGRYAAIDIGTVTARLLVADVDAEGAITELRRETAICNLGVGVDKTGLLDPAAIARVEEVVGGYARIIAEMQPGEGDAAPITVVANATSASRDAKNAGDFVAVLAKLGIELSVIPGQKEAALSFAGATSAFPGERVVVLDVGGGSSEIIAGQAGGVPAHAHSFNIGCRRVTERCLHDDPPTGQQLDEASAWISEEMAEYLATLVADGFGGSYREDVAPEAANAPAPATTVAPCRIVAVAGTATSIISMRESMAVYDSARVHGAVATREDIAGLLRRLAGMTLEERKQVVGLDPGRAPVIVAGLLILQQIMRGLNADSFTVSERDILHGIILDAAAE